MIQEARKELEEHSGGFYDSAPAVRVSPTPSPTSDATPTPTPTQTVTPTPSVTPTLTPTQTQTVTPTPSITPSLTPTITPTVTRTLTPTPTLTPTVTPTMDTSISTNGATQYFWNGSANASFTHTPTSAPRGVLVFVTNVITEFLRVGSVKYGGQSLTLITPAADTAGEKLNTSAWFLGSGIPSGAQTVALTYTGAGSDDQVVNVATVSNLAGLNTQIQSSSALQNDQANPQVTLSTGGRNCMSFGQIGSGFDSVSGLTPLANMTAISSYDAGAKVVRFDRQTTSSTSNFTIGYTATLDDVAYVAVNVAVIP